MYTEQLINSSRKKPAKLFIYCGVMILEPLIGHDIGGVCPFGINDGVKVYLDESLRKHEIVYPAVGSDHSGVKLTISELEQCSGYTDWVDVCK